ncbi:MAG TPA: family 10 glycosylhydrolase, partial [Deferrisomatales bacterium]|nr:family 10 glycosylhydrolase [Deferrisomatales bacterium]
MRLRLWSLACMAAAVGCGATPVRTAGWVVRHELTEPGGAQRICAAAAAGLDQVLVQVRGRGDAYYRSERVPPAESLTPLADGEGLPDPLAEVLAACPEREVVAWLNVYFLWGGDDRPTAPDHVTRTHPEWLLRDADGRSVGEYGPRERAAGWIEGLYADPAAEGYREHFAEVVRELVTRYPVAGVHLDFVRYPGPDYGQGGALGESFATAWGVDPRLLPAELRVPELGPWLSGEGTQADRVLTTAALLWAEARSARVTALVRAVRAVLDAEAPRVRLSAAVFPDPGNAYLAKGQDWPSWAAAGLVDALYPMAYFGGPERVAGQLQAVAGLVPAGTELWAG